MRAALDRPARDGKLDGGIVRAPDDFLDQAAATDKGRQLARRIQQEMEDNGRLSPETLRALQDNGWDPAFAAGLYD